MNGIQILFSHKEFYLLLYLFIINTFSFIYISIDKYRAKKNKWRIRERTFFLLAILGGANGIILGMTMFRHKTQHKSFYIGMPIIYLINLVIGILLVYYYVI